MSSWKNVAVVVGGEICHWGNTKKAAVTLVMYSFTKSVILHTEQPVYEVTRHVPCGARPQRLCGYLGTRHRHSSPRLLGLSLHYWRYVALVAVL